MTTFRFTLLSLFFLWLFSTTCVLSLVTADNDNSNDNIDYVPGVDYSWPMHRHSNAHPSEVERHRRVRRYNHFMQGCERFYGGDDQKCRESDEERISMIRRQPPLMKNYTAAGYAKLKAPISAFTTLKEFYETHSKQRLLRENWPPGNIYTNHWASATKVLPLEGLPGTTEQPSLTESQRHTILTQVQSVLEAWCKLPLVPTSLYGIRVYHRGAVLAPHVDRLPLVISAIINVAQTSVTQEWPLEIIDHGGVARNVTLQPGEMLLYESASIIHGRPYPLNGQSYANVFLHFEPMGHSKQHFQLRKDPKQLFEQALDNQLQKIQELDAAEMTEGDPPQPKRPYYVPHKKQDAWEQKYVYVKKHSKRSNSNKKNSNNNKNSNVDFIGQNTNNNKGNKKGMQHKLQMDEQDERLFHNLAAKGMLVRMKEMVQQDPTVVTKSDHNGWLALHEAARAGHTKVVTYLCGLMDQEEINTRTNGGKGGTPLWWAMHMFQEDHPTVKALVKNGAKSIGPDTE
ncbi:Ankyrin Repeat [Seminavis robusta]|uniref:Ankyrin Repeat n=1 Tax=Seminavis robusta TaxID=568900 RepID=A0A9N8EQ72_9STRA|nr:Ankyrin Repeat [Seminavis robusta]|eukprot:Sro1389_g268540.1 Ankyrin Repeat (513) ;mRNA; f:10610-12363